MNTFEQKIAETVNEKLNDGTVEKLVAQYIEKGVSEALKEIFSYGGTGRKLIIEKLDETIVPVIESHDFNQYLTKLDSVLTEIINSTSLVDNREILANFKNLMIEPENKEIKLSAIFRRYCGHVAAHVNIASLEARCDDDGDPYYGHVTASMEVEHEDNSWFKSSYDDCVIRFTCEEDKSLSFQMKLYKDVAKERWKFKGIDAVDINSLRYLSDFEVFLMTLHRGFVEITMDTEFAMDDDIEPEEKPEWNLR